MMWKELLDQVREQQSFMDLFTKGWIADYEGTGRSVHCRKGCSGCCNLTVNAPFAEALLVAGELTSSQAEAARAHVDLLREWAEQSGSLKDYLRIHRSTAGYCPFLDPHGSCSIYPNRPVSCRSLLSTMESRWCAADFGAMSSEEKRAFVSGLDRPTVAFPLHYVATLQDMGRDMEAASVRWMKDRFGFSLYGSFPALVVLALDHDLAAACLRGAATVRQILASTRLHHPYLVPLEV